MSYIYLAVAIIFEVIGTSALKVSEEFTRLVPGVVVVIGYGISFYFMALAFRTIPIGIAYAVWSGFGMVLVALIGVIVYKQILDAPAVIGMILVIAGVAIMHLYSKVLIH